MKLQEIEPPFNKECIECDYKNDNSWDIEFWQKWIDSVDYIMFNYSKDLISTEDLKAKDGHRGVRIGLTNAHEYDWYYSVHLGYKIEE